MAKVPEHHEEGAPEWMVSFADMVTILMAFFVVMFSMAGDKNEAKEEAVIGSLRRSLGPWPAMPEGRMVPKNHKLAAFAGLGERATDGIKDDGQPGRRSPPGPPVIKLVQPGERTALGDALFFDEGVEGLSNELKDRLRLTARAIAGKPQRIEIRGHASRRPVAGAAEADDRWELAWRRVRAAAEQLMSEGVEVERIRMAVAAEPGAGLAGDDPRWLGKDSCVEVFLLNEFSEPTKPQ